MNRFYLAVIILPISMLSACMATKLAPNAAKLGVNYEWTSATRCSGESPEIRLTGIPEGTKKLRVDVVDTTVSYDHGGGTVSYDGVNVIPAGKLSSFRGPCPPSGVHQYSMTVDAIDASGVIIARGEKTQPCC